MIYSYLKIALRNFYRTRVYSVINLGGLSIGMAVVILVGLWIHDELSFNKYHDHYHKMVQVVQHQTLNNEKSTGAGIPRPLEFAIRDAHGSDFKYLSMCTWTGENILSVDDRSVSKSGNYFQKDFPEMISLRMIKGTRDGLRSPAAIMLSESTAKALFGNEDPINKFIEIANLFDAKVTGVYEDLPYSSSFRDLDFIASWELIASTSWGKEAINNWDNNFYQLYGVLDAHVDADIVSEKIKDIKKSAEKKGQYAMSEFSLHAMRDWHLWSEWKNGINSGGGIKSVWLFGAIGVFVLILACVNFTNLSTARSEKRRKEVGIRMTIGSVRAQLVSQFLIESFCMVSLAFVVSMILVAGSLPLLNDFSGKQISIVWSSPVLWIMALALVVIIGLLAGSYPAFYFSSFRPVKALKGTSDKNQFMVGSRRALVVTQFVVSIMLTIATLTIYDQIQYWKERPVGYDRNGLLMIQMKSQDFFGKFDVLRDELKNSGAVVELSESSSPLSDVWHTDDGFEWQGKDPDMNAEMAVIRVTHEYGKTVGWKIKRGRDFSRDFTTDSTAVIINERAAKLMNIREVDGQEIFSGDKKFKIIGVVEDMVMQSPYTDVRPAIYMIHYDYVSWINVKLRPGYNFNESIPVVASVFRKNIPSVPFDYKLAEEEFETKFSTEERLGKIVTVFCVLAVLISCLGLFGLASFLVEQRTKEIGIRKVLGASVISVCRMLSKDYSVLALLSCVIAIPATFFFIQEWLSSFTYHAEVSWVAFGISAIGGWIIILLTVSYQTVKAALANPVKSLKHE